MTVKELEEKMSLYKVAKLLGLSAPAVYKWRRTGKIPSLRLYQLKEMQPELFNTTPA